MKASDPLPVDAARSRVRVCGDLITKPAMTPLLQAARRRGCKIVTGEDMFAVQRATWPISCWRRRIVTDQHHRGNFRARQIRRSAPRACRREPHPRHEA